MMNGRTGEEGLGRGHVDQKPEAVPRLGAVWQPGGFDGRVENLDGNAVGWNGRPRKLIHNDHCRLIVLRLILNHLNDVSNFVTFSHFAFRYRSWIF